MAEERMYWHTDDPHVFSIGGRQIKLVKTGADYARQSGRIMSWLGRHGIKAIQALQESGIYEEDQQVGVYEFLLTAISLVLDEEALLELAAAVTAEDRKFIDKYFDPGWLYDAVEVIWNEQAGIRYAVQRFANRFFGAQLQAAGEEAESGSSMSSDQDTDGTTGKSTGPSATMG